MDEQHKTSGNHSASRLPIREDSSVETGRDSVNSQKLEIESVKPIFRPPEKITEPIKPHWAYIWVIVVLLVILAWIFLFWYFTNHHAPYSAPLS